MIVGQISEQSEAANCNKVWAKGDPGYGKSKCKDPESGKKNAVFKKYQ